MIMNEADLIIERLQLQPHPEGGYFRETYRSSGIIGSECLEPIYDGVRNYSTCIYFLLTSDRFSAFHKIHQDEVWHFYKGSPIKLHVISKSGNYNSIMIGNHLDRGEVPQYVVKGGDYFAAEVPGKDLYALVGCTVSPGFNFKDFYMPERTELLKLFPNQSEVINQLTRT